MMVENSCAKNIEPPDGYRVVGGGIIQADDMVWNDSYYHWEPAQVGMINDDVTAYYSVARIC